MSHNQIQQIWIGAFLIISLQISGILGECPNCDRCDTNSRCSICKSGYIRDANGICQLCTTNCLQCKDGTSCKVCRPTHFLSAGVCLPCNIDNCTYCDSNNTCTLCSTGYYMKGDKRCHPCKQNCLECSDGSSCQICDSGFFQDSLSECKSCGKGCFKCRNSAICIECKSGFWLMGNECKQCQDNCATCKDAYTCDTCKNGTFKDSLSECKSCGKGCFKCLNSTFCTKCKPGFWLQGNECKKCQDKCATCKDKSTCVECKSGYYGQACLRRCPGNCLGDRCNTSGGCIDGCESGFHGVLCDKPCPEGCHGQLCYMDGSCARGCLPRFYGVRCDKSCPQNCQGQRCHNNGNCRDGCESGFHGVSCDQPCPEKCQSRTCDTRGACKDGCQPRYYGERCTLNCSESNCVNNVCNQNNGTCIEKCPQTCKSCTSTHCLLCRKSFYGRSCEFDCSTCHESACNRHNCIHGCRKGFYLDSNECKQCRKNCTTCESIDVCSICVDGTYGKFCQKTCEKACFACSNTASNCTKCYQGYKLIENKCCPTNCNKCGQDSTCTRCEDGFFGENCASKCYGFCKSCDNKDKCTECQTPRFDSQFDAEEGICSCNTRQCNDTNLHNKTCQSCKLQRGWYSYKNGCCLCPQNCNSYRQCITKGYCKECKTELMDQKCKCQSDACSFCTNEKCDECQSGYFGKDCQYTCSVNCSESDHGSACDKSTGHCLHGCVNGTWGDTCNKTCSQTCSDGLCDVITGHCLICDDGHSGPRCLHVISPQEGQDDFLMPVILAVSVVSALVVAAVIGCLIRICTSRNHHANNTDKMKDIHRETRTSVHRLEGYAEEEETTENATYGMFELSPEAVALEVERARQITRPGTETKDAVERATVFRKQSDSEENTENAMYGAFELSPEEVAIEIERAQRSNANVPRDEMTESSNRDMESAIDVEYSKPIKKSSLTNQAASSVDPAVALEVERARQITRPGTETKDAVERATVFRKQSDSEENTENAMYGAFELSPEEVAIEIERAQRSNANVPRDEMTESSNRDMESAIDVEYSKPIKKSSLTNQAASSVDPDAVYSIPDKRKVN